MTAFMWTTDSHWATRAYLLKTTDGIKDVTKPESAASAGWMVLISNVLLSVTQSVALLKEQKSCCCRPLVLIKNNAGLSSFMLFMLDVFVFSINVKSLSKSFT